MREHANRDAKQSRNQRMTKERNLSPILCVLMWKASNNSSNARHSSLPRPDALMCVCMCMCTPGSRSSLRAPPIASSLSLGPRCHSAHTHHTHHTHSLMLCAATTQLFSQLVAVHHRFFWSAKCNATSHPLRRSAQCFYVCVFVRVQLGCRYWFRNGFSRLNNTSCTPSCQTFIGGLGVKRADAPSASASGTSHQRREQIAWPLPRRKGRKHSG